MDRMSIEIAAAVDVGSNAMRMMIAEITSEGRIRPLEDLRKPTCIGRDTFNIGRIQVETIHRACDILKGFDRLMRDYQVERCRAVATSGVREASNREYLLDQIRMRTGLDVEVINNSQERFLTYKAIGDNLTDWPRIQDEGALLVDIGAGGVEISVYQGKGLQFTEHLKVGSLRLRELLSDLEKMTLDFPGIMEEFIESKTHMLSNILKNLQLKNFVGLGGELKSITNLCIGKKRAKQEKFIEKQALMDLYRSIRTQTKEQILEEYRIPAERAAILLPALILFKCFIELTEAQGIHTPMVSLRHGILTDMVDKQLNSKRQQTFLQDIISSVRYISRKYRSDEVHSTHVEGLALSIFDQTRPQHGLSDQERFYLQIAAILHDIGKYINFNHHDVLSYDIIHAVDIIGLSNREMRLVANVARFHSEERPLHHFQTYQELSAADKVIVSKLTALLLLADSLDITHKQKISGIETAVKGNVLEFTVDSVEDILLEGWTFEQKAGLFEETIGLLPRLRRSGR